MQNLIRNPGSLWICLFIVQSPCPARLFVTQWTARPSYPLSSPGVCPNSCPLNQWYHPTISSSVALFFCPQSFPGSGSFAMSRLFTSGGQSFGASPLASVLPMNSQDWFPLRLTGWISLLSKGLSRVFWSTTVRINSLALSYYCITNYGWFGSAK